MGKRIIAQRRGRGTRTYRVPSYSFRPYIKYKTGTNGKIIDLINYKLSFSPLAKVKYDDDSIGYIIAPEGIKVGDETKNFILPLSKIQIGTVISSIESTPHSGPKFCRTAGSFAILVSKTEKECIVKLPSKQTKKLNPNCIATLGVPAGEGRKEKPWIKAGKKWHAMHVRGKLYPITSASAMNAADHPYGGSGPGKSKSVSRHAPPGRKVGSISSRRTGKKKK